MGLISKALKTTVVGGAAAAGAFAFWTRNCQVVPLPTSDPIFSSPALRKYNPNSNPAVRDLCIRKVPLSKIKPELLEKDGKLVEAFIAGIWGGPGMPTFIPVVNPNWVSADHNNRRLRSPTSIPGAKIRRSINSPPALVTALTANVHIRHRDADDGSF